MAPQTAVVTFVKTAAGLVQIAFRIMRWKLKSICGLVPPKPKTLSHLQHVFVYAILQFLRVIPRSVQKSLFKFKASATSKAFRDFKFSSAIVPSTPGHTWTSQRVALEPRQWAPNDVVVVYIHGGGFNVGSPSMVNDALMIMARDLERSPHVSSASILGVEYPLTPEHSWFSASHGSSQAIETSVSAIRWLHHTHRVPIKNMVICGDSAGGNLAIVVSAVLLNEGFFDREQDSKRCPRAVLLIAPWMDLRPTAASNQPLQSAPPPQHTHFIPTPPPSEQAGTDVSAYLSVTLDTASGGASAPAGTLSKRGVELTSLPNVDESRPITCILDDSVIDCFAQNYVGDLDNANPAVTHPYASPRFLRPSQLPGCPIVVAYSLGEHFGPCIQNWIQEIQQLANDAQVCFLFPALCRPMLQCSCSQ
eukprot:INCI19251.1.p1 GENE.INCI19251.1~~INCI19251.1.p1  ORF type:complete len:442 (-),score=60.85 INCI19251.1:217-1476(-)